MVLARSHSNKSAPLELEVEGGFIEEEKVHSAWTMTNEGKGYTDHDKVEYIKLMQPLFDDITKNMNQQLMKGFELLVS